jgi:hypothetical protein
LLASAVLRRACPALHPVQVLLAFTEVTADAAAAGVVALPGVRQTRALPPGFLRRVALALQRLGPLATVVPGGPPVLRPRASRLSYLLAAHADPDDLREALSSLVWSHPPLPPQLAGPCLCPAVLHPVAALTAFLESATTAYRAARHVAFVRDAHRAPTLSPSSPEVAAFLGALAAAWRDRIDNRIKEPLWRLAVDAFPGARFQPWTCPCGAASPSSRGRRHAFWDCSVACVVRAQLAAHLAAAALPGAPAVDVPCASVWLLRAPAALPGPARRWSRLALVAVAAMEHGRRVLWARSAAGEPDALAAAGNLAAARFWALLDELPPLS